MTVSFISLQHTGQLSRRPVPAKHWWEIYAQLLGFMASHPLTCPETQGLGILGAEISEPATILGSIGVLLIRTSHSPFSFI